MSFFSGALVYICWEVAFLRSLTFLLILQVEALTAPPSRPPFQKRAVNSVGKHRLWLSGGKKYIGLLPSLATMISPERKFRQATARKKRFVQSSFPVTKSTVSWGAIWLSLCYSVRIRAQKLVQSLLIISCRNALSSAFDGGISCPLPAPINLQQPNFTPCASW